MVQIPYRLISWYRYSCTFSSMNGRGAGSPTWSTASGTAETGGTILLKATVILQTGLPVGAVQPVDIFLEPEVRCFPSLPSSNSPIRDRHFCMRFR